MDDKVKDLIYYVPLNAEENRFFEEIEKALGLKLFAWQKTYILAGTSEDLEKQRQSAYENLRAINFKLLIFQSRRDQIVKNSIETSF